jgi:hypothetical protein
MTEYTDTLTAMNFLNAECARLAARANSCAARGDILGYKMALREVEAASEALGAAVEAHMNSGAAVE